jgi:hypothetical protein
LYIRSINKNTMKNLITLLIVLLSISGYSQITSIGLEKELFKVFKEYRITLGKDPSSYDKDMSVKCRNHSIEMNKNKSIYHAKDGHYEICMISHCKFNYFEYHTTQSLAKHVLELFLTSTKGHKEIIEGYSNLIGVGVSIDKGSDDFYITIRFDAIWD